MQIETLPVMVISFYELRLRKVAQHMDGLILLNRFCFTGKTLLKPAVIHCIDPTSYLLGLEVKIAV